MKKIIFNDRYDLTQAVIEGRKTMTRRLELDADHEYIARHYNPIYKPQHCYYRDSRGMCQLINSNTRKLFIPHYKVGEIVAVAQNYSSFYNILDNTKPIPEGAGWDNKMFVRADLMPHQIRITGIKCERLQDISAADCLKEGIFISEYFGDNGKYHLFGFDGVFYETEGWFARDWYNTPREAFAALIDKVSGKGTWASNPWVVAYEFELVK